MDKSLPGVCTRTRCRSVADPELPVLFVEIIKHTERCDSIGTAFPPSAWPSREKTCKCTLVSIWKSIHTKRVDGGFDFSRTTIKTPKPRSADCSKRLDLQFSITPKCSGRSNGNERRLWSFGTYDISSP